MGNTLRHWMKIDHVMFIWCGVTLMVGSYLGSKFLLGAAIGSWWVAFIYDLVEKTER